jgi:hypothetical protein
MDISLGFATILIFIVLPGLLFRRLYFYGEFSKEFNAGYNIFGLVSISAIPGLILFFFTLILSYTVFDISVGLFIDAYKTARGTIYSDTSPQNILDLFEENRSEIFTFCSLLYVISFLFGVLSGRLVRILRLDTRYKLLRFKNHWFYLLNNRASQMKKFKSFRKPNRKYAFTMADVLVDTNDGNKLYSGVVRDYQLKSNTNTELSLIVLSDVYRYNKLDNNKTEAKSIPGELLIVNCDNLLNINLTYSYNKNEKAINRTWVSILVNSYYLFSFVGVIVLPFFRLGFNSFEPYDYFFERPWLIRLLFCVWVFQAIRTILPYVELDNGEYKIRSVNDRNDSIRLFLILTFILLTFWYLTTQDNDPVIGFINNLSSWALPY